MDGRGTLGGRIFGLLPLFGDDENSRFKYSHTGFRVTVRFLFRGVNIEDWNCWVVC